MIRPHLRQSILLLAGVALIWATLAAISGGFELHTTVGRLSSRDWRRPLGIALALFFVYVWRYRQQWAIDFERIARFPCTAVAGLAAVGAFAFGISSGTFIGGGPDSSGYVSQADMWSRGELTQPAPSWAVGAPWGDALWSAAPIGYRPQNGSAALAPVYSPGLPLMMAAFQRLGGARSVFYVVPLLGALAVWAIFLLGRELKSPWAGAIGAVVLASSPAFLWQVIQPMSDVAVTGCWAAALVFACRKSGRSALLAGAATAVAILVRPNLFPLAAIVASIVALYGSQSVRRPALYCLAAVPGPVAVAALNAYWHGSPLRSGYGTFDALYGVQYIWPNITRYTSWLVDTQTPVFISGFAAPFLLRQRAASPAAVFLLCLGFPAAIFLLYVGYIAFDTWQYLRFLLPAYPPVCAGVGVVVVCGLERFRKSALAFGIAVAVIAGAACHGWSMARREGVFRYAAQEQRYARAVSYASGLPQSSVLVSVVYSGALHFYARRDVLRWDVLAANDLDRAVDFLRTRGYPVYFIGDELELDEFTRRFAESRTVNALPRAQANEKNGFVALDLQPGHPGEPAVR